MWTWNTIDNSWSLTQPELSHYLCSDVEFPNFHSSLSSNKALVFVKNSHTLRGIKHQCVCAVDRKTERASEKWQSLHVEQTKSLTVYFWLYGVSKKFINASASPKCSLFCCFSTAGTVNGVFPEAQVKSPPTLEHRLQHNCYTDREFRFFTYGYQGHHTESTCGENAANDNRLRSI